MDQQGLKNKIQTLNDNILKLKYSIDQVVADKLDINQTITAK